tara:strand:+ start:802 stop:1560 length:759 start_codon:yes stop_codon:yes gene_type:complete
MKTPLKKNIPFSSLTQIKKIIKPESKISSLFFYTGELEFQLSRLDHTLIAHTNNRFIFEFWQTFLTEPDRFIDCVENMLSFLSDYELTIFQRNWFQNNDPFARSVLFFLLHNSSSISQVSCGDVDKKRITPIMLSRLRSFKVKKFFPFFDNCSNVLDGLSAIGDVDYIILPIGNYSLNLFEAGKNKGPEMYTFRHKEICDRIKDLDKKCILLYKNHPALFTMYADFNITMVDKYGRLASTNDACEEMIIANF